jgi:choline transport protein
LVVSAAQRSLGEDDVLLTSPVILSIVSFVTITVTCLALQHDKATSSYVWLHYSDSSGWSTGTQFLIALSAPAISFAPIDGAIHLTKEVKAPSRAIPQTIVAALAISFVTALVFTLAMLYSISDFDALVQNPSYFVLFDIWQQATSTSAAAIAFTVAVMIMLPIGSIGCVQVDSMMLWSLGQDHAVPFSSFLGRSAKSEKVFVPVWALLVNFWLIFLIGILYLVSTLGESS